MAEYIVSSLAWSIAGFIGGWFACSRYSRIEHRLDAIDKAIEEQNHDD